MMPTHDCTPPDDPEIGDQWECPDCGRYWRAAADPPTDPPTTRWFRA